MLELGYLPGLGLEIDDVAVARYKLS
jgi:hypothetical protein